MPLYEMVLRFPDRDETRLTDRNGYAVGDEILIAGRRFLVTGIEPVTHVSEAPAALRFDARIVAEPQE